MIGEQVLTWAVEVGKGVPYVQETGVRVQSGFS